MLIVDVTLLKYFLITLDSALQLAKKSFDPIWNEEVIFSFEKPPTNEILNLELHSSLQISRFCQVVELILNLLHYNSNAILNVHFL